MLLTKTVYCSLLYGIHFSLSNPTGLSSPGDAGGAMAPQDFGRSVNPKSTRATDYAHHITTGTPIFSYLPRALHRYILHLQNHWNDEYLILLPRKYHLEIMQLFQGDTTMRWNSFWWSVLIHNYFHEIFVYVSSITSSFIFRKNSKAWKQECIVRNFSHLIVTWKEHSSLVIRINMHI